MGIWRIAGGIGAVVCALAAPAAAQQVRHHKVALEDFRTGEAWPWRGEMSPWPPEDDKDAPPLGSGATPAAALYVLPVFTFILLDFSLTPGARAPLDDARSEAIDLADGLAALRASARAIRAASRLGGPESGRAEARQELLVSGLLGRLGVELLRQPDACAKMSQTMAEDLGGRVFDPSLPPRAVAAARAAERALGVSVAEMDRRTLEGIASEVASLAKELTGGRHHLRHLPALTQALATWKAKRPSLVLCLATSMVSTEAALDIRAACEGFACTYGIDVEAWDAQPGTARRIALDIPFEIQDDKAWSAVTGPILQVRIDEGAKQYRFTHGGVAAPSPDISGLRALLAGQLPEGGCPVVRLDAVWHTLPWGDFLNLVQTLRAAKCQKVVGKRGPPRPAPAAAAKGAEKPAAPPPGLDALRKAQPDLVARLAAALSDLRSPDPGRIAAGLAGCEGCAGAGAAVVAPLLPLLKDGNVFVRAGAIAVLAANPDPRTMEPLARALRDANPMVRARAAEALLDIGDAAAVPTCLEALADPDAHVRELAAMVCEAIPDPRAAEPLAKAADDRRLPVRVHALAALAAVSGDAAVPRLAQAVGDDAAWVRAVARIALVARGTPAAMEPLLARAASPDTPEMEAMALAIFLGKFGRAAGPGLIRLLTDSREGVRLNAAHVLREMRDASLAPALVVALRALPPDLDPEAVCNAIGPCAGAAVPLLVEVLRDGTDHARRAAVRALKETADPASIPPLTSVLRMTPPWADEKTLQLAVQGLGRLGDPAVDPMIELLGRLPKAVEMALRLELLVMTDQPFGADQARWKQWRAGGGKAKPPRRHTPGAADVEIDEPPPPGAAPDPAPKSDEDE